MKLLKSILILVVIVIGFVIISNITLEKPVENTTPTPVNQELNIQFI